MLNILNKIAGEKGNGKVIEMQINSEIRKVLQYAYDPFKKYYMTAPVVDGTPGASPWLDEAYDILDNMTTRKLSGQAALESVCDMLAGMTPSTAEVFKRILNKDLRCGINIKTINKAFPGLIPVVYDGSKKPDIMLLKDFSKKKNVKYPLMVAIKKDGVRARFVGGQFISRQGQKIVGCEHIEKELSDFNHELDGELCVPDMIFDEASGLIRSHNPTPTAVYHVFDIPSIPDTKRIRYGRLHRHINESNHIQIIKHYAAHQEKDLLHFYDCALNMGEEGIVIYEPGSLYEDKRSSDWTRLVPLKQSDCEVIGFFEGKGKHAGSLGGIIVNYKGHVVRVGTGFTEKIKKGQNKSVNRQHIWDHRKQFLGVIAQCEFKEETKAGSMRQPRFKHWRWDKTPALDTKTHLCDSCLHEYPDCGADDVEFGNGVGNDNIYKCNTYVEDK